MKEILLACDLDNTLIYSYKHRVPGDSCVEWLDGQEQSFMTERTQALLRQLPANVRLVPVTTRSKEPAMGGLQQRRPAFDGGSAGASLAGCGIQFG